MTPLPFPEILHIEPTDRCNFKCGVCPESLPDFREKIGYYQRMPEETWIKIFYELAEGPNCLRMIRFWGMGEPLLARGISMVSKHTKHPARSARMAAKRW